MEVEIIPTQQAQPLDATGALVDRWLAALRLEMDAGDLAPSSVETYRAGLLVFLAWLRENERGPANPEAVQRWKATLLARGRTPATINTWLAGVKRFFSWAQGVGLQSDPTAGVKNVKRKGAGKRHLRDRLTDREILRVLGQPRQDTPAGRRDYAILCLMAFCALRSVEIHRADLGDLSNIDGVPVLRVHGKGSAESDDIAVIKHPRAQEAIYNYLASRGNKPGALFVSFSQRSRGKRLSLRSIRALVIGYYRAAGIVDPRKTTHSLRHSAISKVARKNILKARQVARHSRIDTTMIYTHEEDRLDDPGEAFIDYETGNGEG